MRVNTSERTPKSPYHAGEKEMHQRTGTTEVMEEFGRRAIRSFMPDQHRAFFAQLPFMVVGSVDSDGAPWASIVTGSSGFAASPDKMTLTLATTIRKDDPLYASMTVGAQLGLLGIELPTRQRNRLNARVKAWSDDGFTVSVDQSFGNCPQYIQTRSLALNKDMIISEQPNAEFLTSLSDQDRQLIKTADTFFVASYIKAQDEPAIEGVDVSHRGGQPGFVKIDGNILKIPDYTGNFLSHLYV